MNIAYASDENYVGYLAISMISLLENNQNIDICIYIISNGIGDDSKNYLKEICDKYNAKLKIIDMDSLCGDLNVDNTFALAAYARLFLTELKECDRILWCDCDVIVLENITHFYNIDLEENWFAGVLDPVLPYYKKSIGIKRDDNYINSGITLMNLDLLRKNNWTTMVENYIKEYNGSIPHHDQGIINALGNKKIKIVDPKYNATDIYFLYTYKQFRKLATFSDTYSYEQYEEASTSPAIIHFTAGFYGRVWDIKCTHPMKDEFYKYLDESKYSHEEILINKPISNKTKFLEKLYKVLPFGMYIYVLKILSVYKAKRKRP